MSTPFDLSQTDLLLTTTRAVRKRLDLTRPVPRELILDCIRVATQAPAGGNVQKWRWVVVDDPDTKAGLAELYRRAYAPYIEMQRAAVAKVGRSDAGAIIDSSDHLANVLQDVPVLVIPCGLDRPPTEPAAAAGWFGSLLPAVWSFMLAARERGLGSAWTTIHLIGDGEKRVAEIVGIPHDRITQGGLFPVAYTVGTAFKPARRLPLEVFLYWDTW